MIMPPTFEHAAALQKIIRGRTNLMETLIGGGRRRREKLPTACGRRIVSANSPATLGNGPPADGIFIRARSGGAALCNAIGGSGGCKRAGRGRRGGAAALLPAQVGSAPARIARSLRHALSLAGAG